MSGKAKQFAAEHAKMMDDNRRAVAEFDAKP